MTKRVQATISNDLFAHILVLKEYGNYNKSQSFRDYLNMRTHNEQA